MRPRDLEALEFPRVLDAIAPLARSAAGRAAVARLRPTADRDDAERRLDALAETRALAAEAGPPPTADVPPLAPALAAAAPEGAALELRRLGELRDVLGVARAVRAWLGRDAARFPRLAALAAAMPEAAEVEAALASTLDASGQVRDEASPGLAAARAAVRELRAQVEARLLRLVRDPEMGSAIAEHYVTLRNGRFVVPVRAGAAGAIAGVVQDRSGSDETLFVEPLFAVDLNNRLLLASKTEEAEERRVRVELAALVRAAAPALAGIEAALAAVDALGAAAAFAGTHGCTRPTLGGAEIALPAARHPLLLGAGRPVVPVDLRIAGDQAGLALTGPNAGGKTVALKTIGLCALMAQAGLFVPAAEGARLPVFTAVLADVGDEQSIERDLSTFSAHAANLAAIAAAAGPGTLVLLDEPGAGTDPVEGAALAAGVLGDLLARGPRLVFTTHFGQVKAFALAEPALEVAAFDVDPATGAPRFRLVYHTVGQSLALPIARRLGVPERALAAAEAILAGESRDLAGAVARLEESRARLDAARAEAEAERVRLAAARAEAEDLTADLRERQRRRWAEDLDEAGRFLRALRAEGRAVLAELRRRPEPQTLARFVEQAARDVERRTAEVAPPPPTRPPRVGELVEVVGRGIRGELVELAGPRARIHRGGLRFEVPADQVRPVEGAPAAAREPIAVRVAPPPEDAADGEIHLVGQRTRDAVDALTAFLDRAVRTGLSEVRIVHGVGSGALRRAVHELLATSPYCARFRDAEPQAGGAAVTIAELA
ncbi:MAG TPA: Smr/MutS family protein [Candidatus Binatia bacterium]|nr:Smr/MutS family protein [Candidatus Binatia bacterium]